MATAPIILESGKRVLHQMSELVQPPVKSLVALDRIFLSGNNNVHSEGLSLVTYYLAVVAFIRYQHLRSVNFFDECWRFSAVIDMTTCHGKYLRQAVSIHRQMHLGGVASPAFTDVLVLVTRGSGTVLVCFHIAAINEDPFQIGVCFQHVEELFPDAFFRPVIVRLVDGIPLAEMLWQISPWYASTHSKQNAFDCFAQTYLVTQTELKQYFS